MTQPMPPHDPAARLRAAASRLDALCGDATDGPWHADVTEVYGHPDLPLAWVGETGENACDAAYIAAMYPGVGRALAALLWYAAKHRQATESAVARVLADGPGDGTLSTADDIDDLTPFALALADRLLTDGDHRD